ncbi:MAG TPA: MtnX-like HAD-IB family phosphatase [Candidatus Manganitrophaceae bacterium]|nr:MtnX-like HAD-IB family phosphatase [Candidatus Manganitrophaceae bacterium]
MKIPWSKGPVAVFCDFDGTITFEDTTDAVLEMFALPAYKEWEEKWEEGKITAQECMAQQVRLLRVSPEALRAFLKEIPIDPGIYALEEQCLAYGAPLTIVSDGIDFLMEEILSLKRLSHIPHYSNRLRWDSKGRLSLAFPYADSSCKGGCGVCKCRLLTDRRPKEVETIYIGDGLSDCCVVHQADRVFAKKKLRDHCLKEGIAHDRFETLTDVARTLFREDLMPSRISGQNP